MRLCYLSNGKGTEKAVSVSSTKISIVCSLSFQSHVRLLCSDRVRRWPTDGHHSGVTLTSGIRASFDQGRCDVITIHQG
jgi:hypothetical protein